MSVPNGPFQPQRRGSDNPLQLRFRTVTLATALVLAVAGLALATATARETLGDDCDEEISCLSCAIFCRYGQTLAASRLDVGAIPEGIVIHFMSQDPVVIVDLQRFALERKNLHGGVGDAETLGQLCALCRTRTEQIRDAHFDVANSAHGVFAVITSDEPEVVRVLHEMAAEMALKNDVRGS